MSNAPNPTAFTSTVNGDTLNREITMVRNNADKARRQKLNDAQKPVRGTREDGVV
jgi:hypothetical protein